jgi:hypothetical protein
LESIPGLLNRLEIRALVVRGHQCHHQADTLASDPGATRSPRMAVCLHTTEYIFYCKRAILFLLSSKILTPHPPLRPASVYPLPLLRGEDRLAGRRGGWGVYILENERIRLPSYSKICSMYSVLYTIQFKRLIRNLMDKVNGWDREVPTSTAADFHRIWETRRSCELCDVSAVHKAATGRASGRPDATDLRQRVSGGQLHAGSCPMRDGGRVCQVSAGRRQNTVGAQIRT